MDAYFGCESVQFSQIYNISSLHMISNVVQSPGALALIFKFKCKLVFFKINVLLENIIFILGSLLIHGAVHLTVVFVQ